MGFRVSIDGSGPVNLTEQCVKSVKFQSEIPTDSNARATDNGATLPQAGEIAEVGATLLRVGETAEAGAILAESDTI